MLGLEITARRVLEDHELPDPASVGQPLDLDEFKVVEGRTRIVGLKHPLKFRHNIIYWMREFLFLHLMLSAW